jgi:small subunit ribosomal protein S1
VLPRRSAADAGDLENVPELGLSEDVFAAPGAGHEAPEEEAEAEIAPEPEAEAAPEPEAEAAPETEAAAAAEESDEEPEASA